MLKNFWYAVELSSLVTSKPRLLKLLGKEYVLYRNVEGHIIALDNQCAHRGAGLALGWTEGNCIRCPYHGWKYESDGTCSHIPADAVGTSIPKRARINAYPVQEKYGFVWLFVGDLNLPESQRPPTPAFSQFESPERSPSYTQYQFSGHFSRTMENAIDAAHALFVHKGAVGKSKNPEDTVIEHYDVHMTDWEMTATMGIKVNRLSSMMRFLLKQDDPNAKKDYRFALPNITFSLVQFGNYKLESMLAHIPVDDTTTIVKSVNIRNFLNHVPLLSNWLDRNMAEVGNNILREDEVVVKTQLPRQAPYRDMNSELLIASDATLIAYRKLLKKYAD